MFDPYTHCVDVTPLLLSTQISEVSSVHLAQRWKNVKSCFKISLSDTRQDMLADFVRVILDEKWF